jgi:hypothetical protein
MTDILSGLRILTLAFEGYELDHRRPHRCRVSTLHSMVKKLASLVGQMSTFRHLPISSHVLSPSKQSVKSETLDMSDLFPGPTLGMLVAAELFLGARRHRAVLRQTPSR